MAKVGSDRPNSPALPGGAIRNSLKRHRIRHATLSQRDRDHIADTCGSARAVDTEEVPREDA